MSIYIFFALLLLYYYFYECIKCIYVSWPPQLHSWVELALPLRSCLEVWFEKNQARTKALSDQISFRSFSKWSFCSFSLHVFFLFLFLYCFFYYYYLIKLYISFCKLIQKLSVGNPLHSQKSFPMIPWVCR